MKAIHSIFLPVTLCFLLLISCTKEPCEGTLCMNDGVCIDGGCDCTEKFTGPNCSEQKTPDDIRLRTIQLTRFPGLNEGTGWDSEDGPDLYFRLYEGSTPLAQPFLAFSDASDTLDYYFFFDIIDINNVMNEHTLQLRDYDKEDDDDIMGEVKFIPYQMNNGFPSTMILDDGGAVAFRLEVDYLYKND